MTGSYPPVISTLSLTRVFASGGEQVKAVNNVSLDVTKGEFLAVMGRSGSGKTTLLNLMAGLDRPTEGKVLFQGLDLASLGETEMARLRRQKIGFVFQSFGLLPLLSAYENVELPLHLAGLARRTRRERALEALDIVGLSNRVRHRPFELSGGEQQRVAVARALVTRPEVIFADEPTGELDTVTADAIATIFRDALQSQGITIIVATHDPALSSKADRIMQIFDGALVDGPIDTGKVEN